MPSDDQLNKSHRARSQTTAYGLNTREHSPASAISYDENPRIRSLLERDYAFLPVSYTNPGFLFRGLDSGLQAGLSKGKFGINSGDHPLAALEQELGVLLISADFSDSFAVSRLWESVTDAGILIIPADIFGSRYEQHLAATLGFAEPGVVFKYPFFADELAVDDIAYFIVQQSQVAALESAFEDSPNRSVFAADLRKRLIIIDNDLEPFTRHTLNQYLMKHLANNKITKATAIHANHYPSRSS